MFLRKCSRWSSLAQRLASAQSSVPDRLYGAPRRADGECDHLVVRVCYQATTESPLRARPVQVGFFLTAARAGGPPTDAGAGARVGTPLGQTAGRDGDAHADPGHAPRAALAESIVVHELFH